MLADGGLTIAETYPGEAYAHVGLRFRADESKRRAGDRVSKAGILRDWATRSEVQFDADMEAAIAGGFGDDPAGEDLFDAAIGLFGMIEVASGRRAEGGSEPQAAVWEGWIMGQADLPVVASKPALDLG